MQRADKSNTMRYRPDIDGLRCVAVLSVLAFHLSPARLRGGFVGVDVFFVISGYLISAIVFSEIAESRFSILGFYERRIRRIFPALFAMLIVVTVLMSFCLLPTEFVDFSKSLFAATTSSSNFYFWQHSGYFENPTAKPLLHTWSLAVEEQFYILFPIFLVLIRKVSPKHLKAGVLLLFLASLAVSATVVRHHPVADFYMPYTRAWELLAGTIIALGYFPKLRSGLMRNIIAFVGLALIAYAMFRFTSDTPFPGMAALVPCIGSALIIGVGESGTTVVGKILSLKPVVFIGLISYSLYLWHWPLIVLNSLGFSINWSSLAPHRWAYLLLSQAAAKLTLLLLSFLLASLSWRFVERPFRARPKRIERRPLFALSAAVTILLLIASSTTIFAHGFPRRFPARAVRIASSLTPPGAATLGQLGRCAITEQNLQTVFQDKSCLKPRSKGETYLLVGDSHAGSLWEGLAKSMPDANIGLAAVWGCRPSIHAEGSQLCKQMMDFLFDRYLPSHPVQAVLLEARWYSESLEGLDEIATWSAQHGVRVVVFGPVAEYDAPLPRLLAYSISRNKPGLAQEHQIPYSLAMDNEMRELATTKWHTCYVSLYRAACEHGKCVEYADRQNDVPMLSDADHLTAAGSEVLIGRLFRDGQLACLKSDSDQSIRISGN